MKIQLLHPTAQLPIRSTQGAGAFDVFMPEAGSAPVLPGEPVKVGLGFAAEVPEGHVALLLPRSGAGAKYGVELNNTCGVIDSDYRGEWIAAITTKNGEVFAWEAGARVLQFMIVPVADVTLEPVSELGTTDRAAGGFGSTGK